MCILDQNQEFTKGKTYAYSKVRNRKRVTENVGATACEFWEQYQEPGGVIGSHYHDTEETIVLLAGELLATVGDDPPTRVKAPAAMFIPEGIVHRLESVGAEDAHIMAFFGKTGPGSTYTEPVEDWKPREGGRIQH